MIPSNTYQLDTPAADAIRALRLDVCKDRAALSALFVLTGA